jgi:hypothetical protein
VGNGGGRKKPTIVALARKLLVAPWKYVTAVTSLDASRAVFAGFFRCLGVPSVWIRAVMRVESDGQTMQNGVPITSPAGAMGLMQLMPDTYADMQTRYDLGNDPYDPQDNIAAGAAFLHEMYLRYGCPDLLRLITPDQPVLITIFTTEYPCRQRLWPTSKQWASSNLPCRSRVT